MRESMQKRKAWLKESTNKMWRVNVTKIRMWNGIRFPPLLPSREVEFHIDHVEETMWQSFVTEGELYLPCQVRRFSRQLAKMWHIKDRNLFSVYRSEVTCHFPVSLCLVPLTPLFFVVNSPSHYACGISPVDGIKEHRRFLFDNKN